MSLAAWKPGAWKATAWRSGAWETSGAEPETPPGFSGGGGLPRRLSRPKQRNDDDELLIWVLL